MESTLRSEIKKLRRKEGSYVEKIKALKAENARLRAGVRALVDESKASDPEADMDVEDDEEQRGDEHEDGDEQGGGDEQESGDEEEAEDEKEGVEDAKPERYWHDDDDIYRCGECRWEVVDGLCQMCGEQYSDEEDEADDDNKHRSVCTDHEVLNPDRRTAPRGTTPLLDAPRSAASVPRIYLNGRVAEYDTLRSRGATYHMCTTFRLSFDKAIGIIAHLEYGDLLWEEFAGPAMAKRDVWKVCLGRRIVLEEEDIDGSTFVEELLEQVLHFPMCREGDEGARDEWRWETVKEEDKWITRPVVGAEGAVEAKDADSDASSDSASSDSEGLDPGQRYDMMLENPPEGSGDNEPVRRDEYEPTDYDSDEENDEDVEMADGGSSESDDAESKAEVDDAVDFAQPDYAWGESEESDSDAEESEEESEEPSDFFDTSDDEAEATGSATTGTCA